MEKFGKSMAKRPVVPILAVLLITFASLGMIAFNPPSFDMDEGSFTPHNDVTRASTLISETFTSSATAMALVDAKDTESGDIFTKQVFLDLLEFEQQLAALTYTDTEDNMKPYAALDGFSIMSPVSLVARAIADNVNSMIPIPIPIPDPASYVDPVEYQIAYYTTLKNVMGLELFGNPIVTDEIIKQAAFGVLTDPQGAMLLSLLSKDAVIENDSASARGCMIMLMINDDSLDLMKEGQLGFEGDVISAADDFIPDTDGLSISSIGLMTTMNEIGNMAQEDIFKLLPIAIVVIALILIVMYRDIADAALGLLGLLIAIVWTFGICSAINLEITTIAIAVPILIMGLGIDYGLHLVFRYREERRNGQGPEGSTGRTMGSVGEALVLATVTTVIAFLSYLTSSMSALADFGVMCAIGIICAFMVMMLLMPPAQVLRDRRAAKKGKDPDKAKRYRESKSDHGDVISKAAGIGGRMAVKNPWAVLLVTGVVIALGAYSAASITYNFDMYEFVPEGSYAYDALNYMNNNYSSTTNTVSVLVYGDGWDADTIKAMEDSIRNLNDTEIRGLSYQGGNLDDPSYLGTVLSSFNAAYGSSIDLPLPGDPTYSDIYDNVFNADGTMRPIVPETQTYLNILKAATPEAVVSSVAAAGADGNEYARIILKLTIEITSDNDGVLAMVDAVNEQCHPLADAGLSYITTGQTVVLAVSMSEMNQNQMQSLIVTIVLVLLILTIVMYYTDKSWLLGTMATIPTLISVIMIWGTMAMMNMPLNVMTLTIASLAVGMGVTYGIHIAHRYITELIDNDLDPDDAIKMATRETGKGVFGAAITTVAGFGVMGFSRILPLYQFGLITALAITFGYIGAVFVLPSLLTIWGRHAKPKVKQRFERSAKRTENGDEEGTDQTPGA
ncbi:MAG: MMPL family transporter [Methanomassiliicoccaceae archaeon]|nr:MMPL family transporter [Methanomassiliicoccaceae archaeon]